MASNQTQYLKLCQWEADDEVLRADFNADNAKIDAAVTSVEEKCADTAAAVSKLAAYSGNCIVVAGTYIGTGACGPNHPSTLTFPYKPMLVLLEVDFLLRQGVGSTKVPFGSEVRWLEVSWAGNSVTWYTSSGGTEYQCNIADKTYHYVAFLAREEEKTAKGTFSVR